jgi:hypothetical protein
LNSSRRPQHFEVPVKCAARASKSLAQSISQITMNSARQAIGASLLFDLLQALITACDVQSMEVPAPEIVSDKQLFSTALVVGEIGADNNGNLFPAKFANRSDALVPTHDRAVW